MADPRAPWGNRTAVMGVLNLTPDSFSDGGRLSSVAQVVGAAGRMLAQGADLLDLGAQSTRPGAEEVGPKRELERLLPSLTAIRSAHPAALLSIDTFHAAVAEAALAAGADWINDVSGGRRDPAMLSLAKPSPGSQISCSGRTPAARAISVAANRPARTSATTSP